MTLVAFITTTAGPVAMTYGPEDEIGAWVALSIASQPSLQTYTARDGDDLPRCLVDQEYFSGLVSSAP